MKTAGALYRHVPKHENEDQLTHRCDREGQGRAASGSDQHAADRRTGDRRKLERGRQPRVGVGELRGRQQLREDRVHRRRGECARGADHEQQRIDRPCGAAQPRQERQSRGREREHGVREDADVPAGIAIGGVAGNDHQEQDGRELGDTTRPSAHASPVRS